MSKTVRITIKDRSAGERHTNEGATTNNERIIGDLMTEDGQGNNWGARVARNPDDWWNDKVLKMGKKIPRSMSEPDAPWFTPPTETTDQKFESIQEDA